MFDPAILKRIEELQKDKVSFCLVTIVNGRGSIPQEVGAKAIFTREGLLYGTVGGGKIEAKCQEKAIELLEHNKDLQSYFQVWNSTRDLGMTCAGEITLYFEFDRPERHWNIVIFGAGHVSQKLCRFLTELDCRVVCVDTREEWLAKLPRSERLEICQVEDYRDGVKRITEDSFVILVTTGHASDAAVIKAIEAEKLKLPYLGAIGSDSKARILKRQLREEGLPSEFIDHIACPIGEKIGNNTPPEIAISIVAQLLRLRDQVPDRTPVGVGPTP